MLLRAYLLHQVLDEAIVVTATTCRCPSAFAYFLANPLPSDASSHMFLGDNVYLLVHTFFFKGKLEFVASLKHNV